MTRVLVNVYGGVVQDIFCNDRNAEVIVVDWDVEGCSPEDDGIFKVPGTRPSLAGVSSRYPSPWKNLKGTDCEKAMIAAKLKR